MVVLVVHTQLHWAAAQAFNYFDKDKSGAISYEELEAILCNPKGKNPFKKSEVKLLET